MRARHAAAAHQARVINLPRGVVVREHLGGLRDGERQQGGDERRAAHHGGDVRDRARHRAGAGASARLGVARVPARVRIARWDFRPYIGVGPLDYVV